jgi:uncharacterized membrane protein
MPSWLTQVRGRLVAWVTQNRWRPWAMVTPIVVIVLALPLLRPLFWPGSISHSEKLLMASAKSVARGDALRLGPEFAKASGTVELDGDIYASRPPLFAVICAGPIWTIDLLTDWELSRNDPIVSYWVTLVCVTLPTAIGASMLYRTARLFEVPRPWRAAIALTCVLASGWISYATVLSPHAPASAFFYSSLMIVMWVAAAKRIAFAMSWLLLAGMLAAMAVALDPWTLQVVPILFVVTLGLPTTMRQRFIALLLIVVGTLPVIWLHSAWSISTVGTFFPHAPSPMSEFRWDDESPDRSALGFPLRLLDVMLGKNGLLTHFPIMIAGLIGAFALIRKHWPTHAKLLACGSMVAAVVCVVLSSLDSRELTGEMFAIRWAVCVVPLSLLFVGVVFRDYLQQDRLTLNATAAHQRKRRWAIALFCIALVWSVLATMFGATGPLPERPYNGHTAVNAAARCFTER